MARQLFLTLATATRPPPATTARATETVQPLARAAQAEDARSSCSTTAPGLSRRERISAGSLARLLLAADASPVREEFASSLAVAAMDGTVQRRFQNGTVAGQALLKTGTLEGVRALAGYVIDADGPALRRGRDRQPRRTRRARRRALDFLVQWVYRNARRRGHAGAAALTAPAQAPRHIPGTGLLSLNSR